MKNIPNIQFFNEGNKSANELDITSLSFQILNKIDVYVFLFDLKELKPIWVNNYFYTQLNYTYEDLQSLTAERFLELIHPNSLKQFTDKIKGYENNTPDSSPSIYQIKTKDGNWRNMLINTKEFKKGEDDKIRYLLGFATEVRQSELNRQVRKMNELSAMYTGFSLLNKLSEREVDVVRLISQGMTDKEIAEELKVSVHTTKTHRKRIISKLGLKNTAALVKFAVENNIV